jgi:hypothetical protein
MVTIERRGKGATETAEEGREDLFWVLVGLIESSERKENREKIKPSIDQSAFVAFFSPSISRTSWQSAPPRRRSGGRWPFA